MDQSEGSTASVVYHHEKWVDKRYKRGISQEHRHRERDTHEIIAYLLRNSALKVPLLANNHWYNEDGLRIKYGAMIMERVDVSRPLWKNEVSDQHIKVLAEALLLLQGAGYQMRDVEVYIQPDDTLCMLDFGQVTKGVVQTKLLSAAIVPASAVERLEEAWKGLS